MQTGKDKQGKPWRRVYKVDYGYLPKTEGGDGEALDVFLGPDPTAREAYWAIQHKDDGSFDEYKVILGARSRAQAKQIYLDHIPRKYLGALVALPVGMMQSLRGLTPMRKAANLAFFDELGHVVEVSASGRSR